MPHGGNYGLRYQSGPLRIERPTGIVRPTGARGYRPPDLGRHAPQFTNNTISYRPAVTLYADRLPAQPFGKVKARKYQIRPEDYSDQQAFAFLRQQKIAAGGADNPPLDRRSTGPPGGPIARDIVFRGQGRQDYLASIQALERQNRGVSELQAGFNRRDAARDQAYEEATRQPAATVNLPPPPIPVPVGNMFGGPPADTAIDIADMEEEGGEDEEGGRASFDAGERTALMPGETSASPGAAFVFGRPVPGPSPASLFDRPVAIGSQTAVIRGRGRGGQPRYVNRIETRGGPFAVFGPSPDGGGAGIPGETPVASDAVFAVPLSSTQGDGAQAANANTFVGDSGTGAGGATEETYMNPVTTDMFNASALVPATFGHGTNLVPVADPNQAAGPIVSQNLQQSELVDRMTATVRLLQQGLPIEQIVPTTPDAYAMAPVDGFAELPFAAGMAEMEGMELADVSAYQATYIFAPTIINVNVAPSQELAEGAQGIQATQVNIYADAIGISMPHMPPEVDEEVQQGARNAAAVIEEFREGERAYPESVRYEQLPAPDTRQSARQQAILALTGPEAVRAGAAAAAAEDLPIGSTRASRNAAAAEAAVATGPIIQELSQSSRTARSMASASGGGSSAAQREAALRTLREEDLASADAKRAAAREQGRGQKRKKGRSEGSGRESGRNKLVPVDVETASTGVTGRELVLSERLREVAQDLPRIDIMLGGPLGATPIVIPRVDTMSDQEAAQVAATAMVTVAALAGATPAVAQYANADNFAVIKPSGAPLTLLPRQDARELGGVPQWTAINEVPNPSRISDDPADTRLLSRIDYLRARRVERRGRGTQLQPTVVAMPGDQTEGTRQRLALYVKNVRLSKEQGRQIRGGEQQAQGQSQRQALLALARGGR